MDVDTWGERKWVGGYVLEECGREEMADARERALSCVCVGERIEIISPISQKEKYGSLFLFCTLMFFFIPAP